MTVTGLFGLRTAGDLFAKARRDLERFEADPLSVDAAFDFYVSAHHIADWLYPDTADREKLAAIRSLPLMKVCGNVANGAKHFQVTRTAPVVVGAREVKGAFAANAFQRGAFQMDALILELDDACGRALGGQHQDALLLARRIVEFWATHPDLQQSTPAT